MLRPRVQLKPVKCDTLDPDWDFGHQGPDFRVKAIPVHPKVVGGVAKADVSWQQGNFPARLATCHSLPPTPSSVTTGFRPGALTTRTSPACSKAWRARYFAWRSTPSSASSRPPSFTVTERVRPAINHNATAVWSPRPGSPAARVSHAQGIGPFRKRCPRVNLGARREEGADVTPCSAKWLGSKVSILSRSTIR